jgi:transcriptional regulator with XRE-family HTH domain
MRVPKRINQFRKLRLNANLSRQDAAIQLGISESYLEKIENDVIVPGRNTLIKISKFYKCKLDDLFETA